MPDLVIDAYVLAPPDDPAGADAYVARVLGLEALANGGCYRVVPTADAAEVLASTGRYPSYDALRASPFASWRDVARVVDRLLRDTPLEDHLGVATVVLDGPACVPDTHLRGRPAPFVAHHHRVLCLHALRAADQPASAAAVLTALDGLPAGPDDAAGGPAGGPAGSSPTRRPVVARGTALVESVAAGGVTLDERAYRADILLVSDVDRVAADVGAVALWQDGCLQLALREAVRRRTVQDSGVGPDTARVPSGWEVGDDFWRTAAAFGFGHERGKIGRLVDACVDAIVGDPRRGEPHPLRTNRGPNAANVTRARDDAVAMRRDIDDEFHLHYWRRPGRGPELASVVVHNDFSIPG